MATRSSISVLYKNGTVKSIYCHNDGYLSYNGKFLILDYQDFSKVDGLMALGNLSSLDQNLNPTSSWHSFDKKEDGVCVAYMRDRQEEDQEAQEFENLENFIENGNFQEYDYVYKEKNQTWYLLNGNKKLQKLSTIMKRSKELSEQEIQEIISYEQNLKLKNKLNKNLPVQKGDVTTQKI